MINYLFGGAFAITASYMALRALMAKFKKAFTPYAFVFEWGFNLAKNHKSEC
ncbi:MAG: hypothetical protein HWN80_11635 [Candidatus Lokiarchaeota archaeon]|nr:hypothetical protein [Candidatus Lokiarchaeota archaeon]